MGFKDFFKSVYKKLIEDFDFLRDYGFVFAGELKHYESPSVRFVNQGKIRIQIGFHYREHRFYINIYRNPNDWHPLELLESIELKGERYKDQVADVKNFLKEYLEKFLPNN